mgnify:CR=1 FL=1
MKTKKEIVENWLPRYTGTALEEFGEYILLTNFSNYLTLFAEEFGVEVKGSSHPMQMATANGISIINFGMGSAMAATVPAAMPAERDSTSTEPEISRTKAEFSASALLTNVSLSKLPSSNPITCPNPPI